MKAIMSIILITAIMVGVIGIHFTDDFSLIKVIYVCVKPFEPLYNVFRISMQRVVDNAEDNPDEEKTPFDYIKDGFERLIEFFR